MPQQTMQSMPQQFTNSGSSSLGQSDWQQPNGAQSSGSQTGQSAWQQPSAPAASSAVQASTTNATANTTKAKAPLLGGVLDQEELNQANPNIPVGAAPASNNTFNGGAAVGAVPASMGTTVAPLDPATAMMNASGMNPAAALLGGGAGGANMMGTLAPAMMMLMQAMPAGGLQLPRFNTPGSRTYIRTTGPVNSSQAAAMSGQRIGNQVGRSVGRALNQAAQQGMSRAMMH
jgi:hypothetical protein